MPEYVKILRVAGSIRKKVATGVDQIVYGNPVGRIVYGNPLGRATMSGLASYNIFNGIKHPGVEGLVENAAIFVPMSIILSVTVREAVKDLYRLALRYI